MNGFVTTNLQDNEIVKADDVQIAGDNSILNMEKFFKVLVNAKKNVVIGGKLKAYVTGNLLAAKMDPVIGYNIETEEMFSDHEGKVYMDGSDTISDYILFSPADTSDRIDTVEMKSEILEGNLQSRQFYNPTTEGTSSSPTNIEKRKIVRCKVLKGIPGSNAAPSVENGYVKIAEVVISASVSELTDSDIKNITADIDTENTSWTMDKNSVINPGSIQEVKNIFRNIHNSDGTLKNEVVKAANILLSGTGSLNGSNILKGGATEVISETTSILPNDSIATAMNKTVNAIAECKEELTSYVDGKELTDFGGVAEITQGGTGATTEKSAQYNLIGNTPESVDIELDENKMMYLENPNKSAEFGAMLKIKLSKLKAFMGGDAKVIFDVCHPIGEKYIQLGGEPFPWELYTLTTKTDWQNISDTYKGEFFRVVGGNSASTKTADGTFAHTQQAEAYKSHNHGMKDAGSHTHRFVDSNQWSGSPARIGATSEINIKSYTTFFTSTSLIETTGSHSHTINSSGGNETRPVNSAIQIWKRIS